jgi:hypothetical protein
MPVRNRAAAYAFFDNVFDAFGNTRVALHQRVQVVCVQHKQIGAGQRDNCRGTPRATQHRYLSEKLTSAEAKGFFLAFQGNFDFARRNEVHGVSVVPFADDDLPRLGNLRPQ